MRTAGTDGLSLQRAFEAAVRLAAIRRQIVVGLCEHRPALIWAPPVAAGAGGRA
ncbi:MAG: hypothetical protein V4510_09730 [bacterium]